MSFASSDILFEVPKLLDSFQLMTAIRELRRFAEDHPYEGVLDRISGIESDYQLLLSYARQGYQDPSREQLYQHMKDRLFRLCQMMLVRHWKEILPFYRNVAQTAGPASMSNQRLQVLLEGYVSDQAMLSLEVEEARENKRIELHQNHQNLIAALFGRLVVSDPWTEDEQEFFESLLLSPTIDRIDVLLMLSALMIAVIQTFDLQKFITLLHVYQRSTDEYVRQRALVGWCFALQADLDTMEPVELVGEVCRDPKVMQDVIDLQKQLVFCIKTQQDNEKIQKDIIPTLMKNNNFTISRDGIITEKEDDLMESILHPDAEERRMEEVEESMRKMMDMQQAGSDIYFAGFSQMKRFPFFYKASNWFCPFYLDHPGIAKVAAKLQSTGFLSNLVQYGPFCDSDKYSFTLAMSSVIDRLPDNVKEMMGNADSLGPVMDERQMSDAAYIRRMYLQDLYRFYCLHDEAKSLKNPFAPNRVIFIKSPSLEQTEIATRYPEVCVFFIKHGRAEAFDSLYKQSLSYLTISHRIAYASWLTDTNRVGEAVVLLEGALEEKPDSEQVLRSLARAYYLHADYQKACALYGRLRHDYPQKASYALNYGITLSKNEQYDEAVRVLYQLDFEHPSQNVTRGLAWALMGQHKLEQAEREYQKLLASSPMTIDYLNAGYCEWFLGHVQQAVLHFRTYIKKHQEAGQQVDLKDDMRNDAPMLRSYGVSEIDRGILYDLVAG